MLSYSSWRGCSVGHLGWLLALKQFSWAWESEMEVGTGLVCVQVLLWQRPDASKAHGQIQEPGSAPRRGLVFEHPWQQWPPPSPATYAGFPEPLNQSFKLLLQKMRAVITGITFQKKSNHTLNVSNTILLHLWQNRFWGKTQPEESQCKKQPSPTFRIWWIYEHLKVGSPNINGVF